MEIVESTQHIWASTEVCVNEEVQTEALFITQEALATCKVPHDDTDNRGNQEIEPTVPQSRHPKKKN